MNMTSKAFAAVLMIMLAGCVQLEPLEQKQQAATSLLQQQSIRLEMYEEYLAQLAESQQALTALVGRVEQRMGALEAHLPEEQVSSSSSPEGQADSAAEAPAAGAEAEPSAIIDPTEHKVIVGRNEWVWLELMNRNLKARVDTGALSSSLNAVDLQPFERNGNDWIRFRVPDEDHPDGGDIYETPLVRYVRIRQASSDELDRRPVVRLTARLGDLIDEVEFSLTNREDMMFPLLLGRNFLRDIALVDVAREFTQPKFSPASDEAQ